MKTFFTTLFILVISITTYAQVSKVTIKDQSVSAVFFNTDGCFEILTQVTGGYSVLTDNGTITATPLASVTIGVWDNCTNTRVLYAQGTGSQFIMKIDANLKTASLKAIGIPCVIASTLGTAYADVDLIWSPTGKSNISNYNYVITEDGVTFSSHAAGTIRTASATGSVKLHGCIENVVGVCNTIFNESTNFTAGSSFDGFIVKSGSHEMTITHSSARMEESLSAVNDLALYPNPVTTSAALVFNSANESNYEFAVTDVTGRTLLHTEGNATVGENKINMDISGFAAGMYFVTVKNGGEANTLKLVKE